MVGEVTDKRNVLSVWCAGDSTDRRDEDGCGHLGHASATDNHGRSCGADNLREKLKGQAGPTIATYHWTPALPSMLPVLLTTAQQTN